jgi:hypothetical protein
VKTPRGESVNLIEALQGALRVPGEPPAGIRADRVRLGSVVALPQRKRNP